MVPGQSSITIQVDEQHLQQLQRIFKDKVDLKLARAQLSFFWRLVVHFLWVVLFVCRGSCILLVASSEASDHRHALHKTRTNPTKTTPTNNTTQWQDPARGLCSLVP